jgi:hypothetical protein
MDGKAANNARNSPEPAAQAPSVLRSADQPTTMSADSVPPLAAQTPLPSVPKDYSREHRELYEAWVDHIRAGYENNDQIFQRILDAFMRSHNSTVIMNWILFGVGIGFFVTSVLLALFRDAAVPAVLFGGLSVGAFLTYFLTRPTQAVEENLQYVTWLGIIYNSYWTRLAWSFDEESAQAVLDEATEDAIVQLKDLVERHAESTGKRPKLPDMPGDSAD